jgi:hypothetical protein
MVGVIEVLDLEYSQGAGPASVVVKLPAVNEANLIWVWRWRFQVYRHEVNFCRELADRTPSHTLSAAAIDHLDGLSLLSEFE